MQLWTLIGLVGLVFILVEGKILDPIKAKLPWDWLRYLLGCYQCSGFWVGFCYGIWVDWQSALIFGGVISLASLSHAAILDKLQKS